MLAGLLEPAGRRGAAGRRRRRAHACREQAHYVGHRDALKPALTPRENLDFWQAMLGAAALHARTTRWSGWASTTRPTCPAPTCRPGSGAASRWPGCWCRGGRSGCSTSRPRRSTPPRRRCSTSLVAEHLAGGGLVVAATHVPLGFPGAATLRAGRRGVSRPLTALLVRELRLAVAHRRRRRDGPRLLPHAGHHRALRHRAGPEPAVAHRPGDPLDRRGAGHAARASTGCSRPTPRTARST